MIGAACLALLLAGQTPSLSEALETEARSLRAERAALEAARAALERDQARAEAAHLERSARLAGELERLRIELEQLEAERRRRSRDAGRGPDRPADPPEPALRRELRASLPARALDGSPAELRDAVLADDLAARGVRTSSAVVFFGPDGAAATGRATFVGALAAFARADGLQGPLQRVGDRWALAESADVGRLFGVDGPPLVPLVWGTPHEGAGDEKPPFFASRLEAGGPVAIAILVLAGLAMIVFLERLAVLVAGTRGDEAFVERFLAQLGARDVDAARQTVDAKAGWVSALARRRLEVLGRAKEVRADLLEAALARQVGAVERGVPFLKLVAAVAPLLGLLGTVMGMIETFDVLGTHGAGDARLLSGGISKALVTTELGLIVAIPTLFAHSLVSSWIDRVVDRLERVGLDAAEED